MSPRVSIGNTVAADGRRSGSRSTTTWSAQSPGYRIFDVLLVNPIYDGMNLVAKEGPLVNERDGVLVLSENAGSHEELGEWAITVNPFDIDETAEALYLGLMMDERRRRPGRPRFATWSRPMTSRAGSRSSSRTSAS